MRIRTYALAAGAAGLLGAALPVAAANAEVAPAAHVQARPSQPLVFVPPRVGPIVVSIGPTIIGGRIIDAGLRVQTPGVVG